MHTDLVLDHFHHPRHAGVLESADAVARAENPACGDVLEVSLRVEAGRVVAAAFRAQGCVATVACGSRLAELLSGADIDRARALDAEQLAAALGGLPAASRHGAALAMDALRGALRILAGVGARSRPG